MSHTELQKEEREAGFSLLELLLVVGVGALLLLAGIATYRLVTQGNNVNDAVRILTTIKQQTQRAFQGQSSYGASGDDLVPTLISLNAFPAGVLIDDTDPQHPWGDTIVIEAEVDRFTVTFTAVPEDACIQLGTTFDEQDSDFVSLDVAGDLYAESGSTIDPAALATSCDGDASMTWTFF